MGQNKCSTRTRTFFNGFITNLVVNNFWHDHPSLLSFGLVSFERSSSLKSIVICDIDDINQPQWATVTFVKIIILILSQSGLESSAASGSVKKITPPSAKKSKWNIEHKSLKQSSKQDRLKGQSHTSGFASLRGSKFCLTVASKVSNSDLQKKSFSFTAWPVDTNCIFICSLLRKRFVEWIISKLSLSISYFTQVQSNVLIGWILLKTVQLTSIDIGPRGKGFVRQRHWSTPIRDVGTWCLRWSSRWRTYAPSK